MPGMHGNYTAVTSMQRSDLLIALGARFDDRVTGKVDAFAPDAKIIHVDIDPAELGKVRRPDVPIVGDCRLVIEELVEADQATCSTAATAQADTPPGSSTIVGLAGAVPADLRAVRAGRRAQAAVLLEQLRRHAPEDTIVASGVGQHQMWTVAVLEVQRSRTPGSTPVGSARWASRSRRRSAPRSAEPDHMVWAIDGDGCFQMTAQELVTATVERHPDQGRDPQQQPTSAWSASGRRCSTTSATREVYLSPDLPDYVMWAEAMGCVGIRVESPEEVAAGDREGELDRRPPGRRRVPHRRLARRCSRWSPPGFSNDDMILHPTQHDRVGASRSMSKEPLYNTPVGATNRSVTTSSRCSSRTGAACSPAWPACSPGAASTSSRSPSRRPRTSGISRITIVVDVAVDAARAGHQAAVQADRRGQDHRARPASLGRARAADRHGQGDADDQRGQVVELVNIFEGKILAVGHRVLTVSLDGHPDKLDDFEDLLAGYGIVELQRTGRVALPKLERRPHGCAPCRPTTRKG